MGKQSKRSLRRRQRDLRRTSEFFESPLTSPSKQTKTTESRQVSLSTQETETIKKIEKGKHPDQDESSAPAEEPTVQQPSHASDFSSFSADAIALRHWFEKRHQSRTVEDFILTMFDQANMTLRGYYNQTAEDAENSEQEGPHELGNTEIANEQRQKAERPRAKLAPQIRGGGAVKGPRFSELLDEEDANYDGEDELPDPGADESFVDGMLASTPLATTSGKHERRKQATIPAKEPLDKDVMKSKDSIDSVQPIIKPSPKRRRRKKNTTTDSKEQDAFYDIIGAERHDKMVNQRAGLILSSRTAEKSACALKYNQASRMSDKEIDACLNTIKEKHAKRLRRLEQSSTQNLEKMSDWIALFEDELSRIAAVRQQDVDEDDFDRCLTPHIVPYLYRLFQNPSTLLESFDILNHESTEDEQSLLWVRHAIPLAEEIFEWFWKSIERSEVQNPRSLYDPNLYTALYREILVQRLNSVVPEEKLSLCKNMIKAIVNYELETRFDRIAKYISLPPNQRRTFRKEKLAVNDTSPKTSDLHKGVRDATDMIEKCKSCKKEPLPIMSAEEMSLYKEQIMKELKQSLQKGQPAREDQQLYQRDFIVHRFRYVAAQLGKSFNMDVLYECLVTALPSPSLALSQPSPAESNEIPPRSTLKEITISRAMALALIDALENGSDLPIFQQLFRHLDNHPDSIRKCQDIASSSSSELSPETQSSQTSNDSDEDVDCSKRGEFQPPSSITALNRNVYNPSDDGLYDPLHDKYNMYPTLVNVCYAGTGHDWNTLPRERSYSLSWKDDDKAQTHIARSAATIVNLVSVDELICMFGIVVREVAVLLFKVRNYNIEKRFGLYPERIARTCVTYHQENAAGISSGGHWNWWPRTALEVLNEPESACMEVILKEPETITAPPKREENRQPEFKIDWEAQYTVNTDRVDKSFALFDGNVHASRVNLKEIEKARRSARKVEEISTVAHENSFWQEHKGEECRAKIDAGPSFKPYADFSLPLKLLYLQRKPLIDLRQTVLDRLHIWRHACPSSWETGTTHWREIPFCRKYEYRRQEYMTNVLNAECSGFKLWKLLTDPHLVDDEEKWEEEMKRGERVVEWWGGACVLREEARMRREEKIRKRREEERRKERRERRREWRGRKKRAKGKKERKAIELEELLEMWREEPLEESWLRKGEERIRQRWRKMWDSVVRVFPSLEDMMELVEKIWAGRVEDGDERLELLEGWREGGGDSEGIGVDVLMERGEWGWCGGGRREDKGKAKGKEMEMDTREEREVEKENDVWSVD